MSNRKKKNSHRGGAGNVKSSNSPSQQKGNVFGNGTGKAPPTSPMKRVEVPDLFVVVPASEQVKMMSCVMNYEVMRILGFGFGNYVCVRGENVGLFSVSRCWPSKSLEVDCVQMTSILCERCGVEYGDRISIELYRGIITNCAKLEIKALTKLKNSDRLVNGFILSHLVGHLVRNDHVFTLSIYGTKYKFVIENVSPQQDGEIVYKVRPNTIISVKNDSEKKDITTVSFDMIGGLEEQVKSVRELVELPLYHPEIFEHIGLECPRGVLIYGPPGTGKTLLARAVAHQIDAEFYTINGPEIISKFYGESEAKLREKFALAEKNSPSIIFIDEIDAIAPSRESGSDETEKRVVGTLLTLMDGIEKTGRIVVIAATNRPNSIDNALRRPGRFDREVEIGIPTVEGRKEILDIYLNLIPHSLTPEEIIKFSEITHGYVGADLSLLCQEASVNCIKRSVSLNFINKFEENDLESVVVNIDDFEEAMANISPSAMREIMVDIPKVKWSDIGGYEGVKSRLRELVEWPIKYAQKFSEMNIEPPRGVLLYGPPGCSKTLMAKAIANEAGLNFIPVKGPELFSKYVGDSEKAVRDIFRKARQASPSIIFFDEIDALAVERGSGDGTSVQDRVISQMLTELDGITPLNNVLFLAATNRPDIIDSALMRPGRIDRVIYIPLPDTDARRKIFEISMENKNRYEDDISIDVLSEHTEGYSGAEIVQVCREAVMSAMGRDVNFEKVTSDDFAKALKLVPPRTKQKAIDFYEQYSANSSFI